VKLTGKKPQAPLSVTDIPFNDAHTPEDNQRHERILKQLQEMKDNPPAYLFPDVSAACTPVCRVCTGRADGGQGRKRDKEQKGTRT